MLSAARISTATEIVHPEMAVDDFDSKFEEVGPERGVVRILVASERYSSRRRIGELIREFPDFEIAGECATIQGLLKACEDIAFDAVILDMNFVVGCGPRPEAAPFGASSLPWLALSDTERWAFQAFEMNAVDYVLEFSDRARFERALMKLREKIDSRKGKRLHSEILARLNDLRAPLNQFMSHIVVKTDDGGFLLRLNEVDWIEAEGNYVRFHVGKRSHLVRENIGAIESQIDPSQFLRIHRSTIVRLDRIERLHPIFHGDLRVILKDGTELTLSRRYRKNIKGF